MTHSKTFIAIVSLVCLTSIFAFGKQNQPARPTFNIFEIKPFDFRVNNFQSRYRTTEVSENMAYEQLFRLIDSFERQADKQAGKGHLQRAELLRSFLERKIKLSSAQSVLLKSTAKNFLSEVEQLDGRALEILETEKRRGKSENLTRLFADLENYRAGLSLQYRNRITEFLQTAEFERFAKFVRENIAAKMTLYINPHNDLLASTMSMIDYQPGSSEILGYSQTTNGGFRLGSCDFEKERCEGVGVYATLSSDRGGVIDEDDAEACDYPAEAFLFGDVDEEPDTYCVDGYHYTDFYSGCSFHSIVGLGDTQDCVETTPPTVESVNFELIATDSPPIDEVNNSLRIFPDDNTPGDMTNRQQIRVTAQISENIPGITVYFANFDLDDPSTDTIIDPNGNAGDDNNGEVNGNRAGQLSAVSAVTNNSGVATVNFTVTRQPGDNFAIAASTRESYLNGVTVQGTELRNGSETVPISCSYDPACRTEMLTVWRRLHIEVDSMGESQGNFVGGNFAESALIGTFETDVQVNTSQDLEVNRFENGRLVSGSRNFRIVSNTTNSVRIRVFSGGNIKINQSEIF